MFDKSKRQKQEKAYRGSLRMLTHLADKQSATLVKHNPNYLQQNILKLSTCLHINYLVFSYLEAIEKANIVQMSRSGQSSARVEMGDVRVGIIGGGAMGRLVLNSLLVLQKEGLEPANITLSTRQFEQLDHYRAKFKVNLCFDNNKLAEESDILIITVPATLDNWVIADLREPLSRRASHQAESSLAASKAGSEAVQKPSTARAFLNPLVYITTSNMTEKKLEKLFQFPILTPVVRGEEQGYLEEIISYLRATTSTKSIQDDGSYADRFAVEEVEKYLAARIAEKEDRTRQTLFYCFEKYFFAVEKDRRNDRASKTSQPTQDKKQKVKSHEVSMSGSSSSTTIISHLDTVKNLVADVLSVHETTENTFLVRCRKWRMSYSNFIA